jgi:hypothetical protein
VGLTLTLSVLLLTLGSALVAQSSRTSEREHVVQIQGSFTATHPETHPGALLVWRGEPGWLNGRDHEESLRIRQEFRQLLQRAEKAGVSFEGTARAYALVDNDRNGLTVEGQHLALSATGDSVLVVMVTVAANDAGRLVHTLWLPQMPKSQEKQWTSGDTTFTIRGPEPMDLLLAALKKTPEGAAFLR